MKHCYLLLTLVTILSCCTRKEKNDQHQLIEIGQVDSLYSKNLGEQRKFWIRVPESAKNHENNSTTYPILYLFDGDGHFHAVTGMLQQLSECCGNELFPETIVVGIPNTDRTRDLTPTHVNVAFGDSSFVKTSGGHNNFMAFMEEELIPFVANKYPANNYRTLVGHSLGGLAVINTLLKRPELFENYVAIDPSLWWDDQILLKQSDSLLSLKNYENKSLFVGMANTMNIGMDTISVMKDTSSNFVHIRSIIEFSKARDRNKDNGLNFDWKYYPEDSHSSVPFPTEYDAFRFLFKWYKLPPLDNFYNPGTTAEGLLNHVTSHYNNVSDHLGYKVLPKENRIHSMAQNFLFNNMPQKALVLFQWNIENSPNSATALEAMGDYYLSQSDSLKAKTFFSKALTLDANVKAKEKLEQLKKN